MGNLDIKKKLYLKKKQVNLMENTWTLLDKSCKFMTKMQ